MSYRRERQLTNGNSLYRRRVKKKVIIHFKTFYFRIFLSHRALDPSKQVKGSLGYLPQNRAKISWKYENKEEKSSGGWIFSPQISWILAQSVVRFKSHTISYTEIHIYQFKEISSAKVSAAKDILKNFHDVK